MSIIIAYFSLEINCYNNKKNTHVNEHDTTNPKSRQYFENWEALVGSLFSVDMSD